jgi:hypothetical protein
MASGAPFREGRFIATGQGFHVILLDSGCSCWLSGVLGAEVDDVWDVS